MLLFLPSSCRCCTRESFFRPNHLRIPSECLYHYYPFEIIIIINIFVGSSSSVQKSLNPSGKSDVQGPALARDHFEYVFSIAPTLQVGFLFSSFPAGNASVFGHLSINSSFFSTFQRCFGLHLIPPLFFPRKQFQYFDRLCSICFPQR